MRDYVGEKAILRAEYHKTDQNMEEFCRYIDACFFINYAEQKELEEKEMNMEYEVISMLARARLYIKDRRPQEDVTLEILQDLIDVAEGARRAKLIN